MISYHAPHTPHGWTPLSVVGKAGEHNGRSQRSQRARGAKAPPEDATSEAPVTEEEDGDREEFRSVPGGEEAGWAKQNVSFFCLFFLFSSCAVGGKKEKGGAHTRTSRKPRLLGNYWRVGDGKGYTCKTHRTHQLACRPCFTVKEPAAEAEALRASRALEQARMESHMLFFFYLLSRCLNSWRRAFMIHDHLVLSPTTPGHTGATLPPTPIPPEKIKIKADVRGHKGNTKEIQRENTA